MSLPKILALVSALCFGAIIFNLSVHTVQEGYVGVVYTLGSLQQGTLKPGLHFTMPFITRFYQVQTTMQTDYVLNVPCGTNSGVNIMFDKIEVVNQLMEPYVFETVKSYTVDYDKPLIFDKITYEMAQFCSKTSLQEVFIEKFDQIDEFLSGILQKSLDQYAPGLKIISVRLSKPIVPNEVQENYKKIVQYQTEILKSKTEQQKELLKIQTENEKSMSQLNSEKELALSKLKSDQERKIYEIEANKLFELAQTEALREKEIARITAEEKKKMAQLEMEMAINAKTIEKDTIHKKGILEVLKLDTEAERLKKNADTDNEHYRNMKHAEYMKQLMTPGYVAVEVSKSISSNSKIFYGDSLPKMFNFPGMAGVGGFPGVNFNLTNF
ncbi:erlin-2-B [Yasminevirus sp. GU-2018]|uniref:Erlin-2-B n=1 Tax=Yasminevirus sp. GU-2018 TaxID=2420051 RepID=A0A5K0UA07_9VIRU|nr:erlin-2-B [Yasminevirus sp. GU-2018]